MRFMGCVLPIAAAAREKSRFPFMSEQPPFLREIDTLIRARYPLLYLVTFEEQRVDALLGEVARAHGKELVEWSATRGLRIFTGALRGEPIENTTEPVAALMHVLKLTKPSIVLLKDFHRYLEDALVVRTLRELGNALKSAFTTVLVVAPVLKLPEELEKDVSVVDVPLPDQGGPACSCCGTSRGW